MIKLSLRKGEISTTACDILIVSAFQGNKEATGIPQNLTAALNGLVEKVMREENFHGKLGQTLLLRTEGLIPAKRLLCVGLGKKEELSFETVRETTAVSFHAIREINAKSVVSVLHAQEDERLNPKEIAQAMTESFRLATYSYDRFKKAKKVHLTSFEMIAGDSRIFLQAKKGMETGELFARATLYARDLVNAPAHHMHPMELVSVAKGLAKNNPSVRVKIYNKEQLAKMGAGGILGVAQGSDHPPFMVHLTYKPKKSIKKSVALVGKAVTFDSGGLSLKPAEHMMTMKIDMAGAAAVLGVFSVLAQVAPSVEVHGIFAPVENMPSGKAIRPGDIVQAMNKKTVEVLNTDAEGRLTLMDMLVYAQKYKPDYLIDLATLTGACVVALGEEITGVMSNNPELAKKIFSAAQKAGEKMWELPLEKNYAKLVKSSIADLQNIGGRYGGALTAGLFLQEFVSPKTPWAHLDIAGPAFAERDINSYTKKGATGHPVRTLLQFLMTV